MNQREQVLKAMTEKQARRYALFFDGETMTEIARKEGVSIGAVSICLKNAERRAKNRLKLLK